MFLKKLEIHGFKSFAKQFKLEFEPGITSVVGPNGSGKSNIADALRWVFGEQSMKLLRGKKSEDVIFAGSDKKARLGMAEVQVFFDNTDHKFPLDFGEVVLSRRVFRDGNSEYLINGSKVRLLDIQELLGKTGFGNTSYHVIGQGMIDQLILGGPSALKELVEEAAAIKPYYVKRDKTLRRLDQTGRNLEQARALLAEIEPRLRSLRRQTKRLEKREEVEKELRHLQALHYSHALKGISEQLDGFEEKAAAFEKENSELSRAIEKLSHEIETQEKEFQKGGSDSRKLKQDLEALQKQRFALQERLATVQGQLKVEQKAGAGLAVDWSLLRKKFKEAYDRLRKLVGNWSREEAEEVADLFGELDKMLEEDAGAQAREEASELKKEEDKLAKELSDLFAKIKTLESDLLKYNEKEAGTKQQLFVKERLLRNKQEAVVKAMEQKNLFAVEQAKLQTRQEALQEEAGQTLGADFEKILGQSEGDQMPHGIQEKIANLKRQLENIGGVDEMLIQEYKETEERYQYLSTQSEDLAKAADDLKNVILELDQVIKKEFDGAFRKISEKFEKYFRILFGGGKAAMTLLRESLQESGEEAPNPFLKKGGGEIVGIEIKATPPGKKLAGIAALSGGERALTAIAFLSSILDSFPSPFVVLDEVDAALDEANSIRFGKILGSLADKTQFITITHNRETMRQSHTLYGVTMGDDGISKVLSLKLDQAAVYSTKN